jgi:hypothetical protein
MLRTRLSPYANKCAEHTLAHNLSPPPSLPRSLSLPLTHKYSNANHVCNKKITNYLCKKKQGVQGPFVPAYTTWNVVMI